MEKSDISTFETAFGFLKKKLDYKQTDEFFAQLLKDFEQIGSWNDTLHRNNVDLRHDDFKNFITYITCPSPEIKTYNFMVGLGNFSSFFTKR